MDDTTRNAERAYWADPTFDNYRRWFRVVKRAGRQMPLDAARHHDFSVAEDKLSDFTLFGSLLSEVYSRTQLAASNVLSAAEQSDTVWLPPGAPVAVNTDYNPVIDHPSLPRRWFWCPMDRCYIYYFVIDKQQWAISNDTDIVLTAKIPYEIVDESFVFPFEKCNYCDRQAFLVEFREDNLDITALLDCFSNDDPKHPFIIEDEHDVTFADFSGGHQFDLLERLERLQGMDIHAISPPSNSIELPTSG